MSEQEINNWPELVAHLESRNIATTIAGPRRVTFELANRDRSERMMAWQQASSTGASWVGLAVTLGEHSIFRKRAALVANKRLPVGAFSLFREVMLLTQSLPLLRLRTSVVDETLAALTGTVEMLSNSSWPDLPEDEPFAYVFTRRMVTP